MDSGNFINKKSRILEGSHMHKERIGTIYQVKFSRNKAAIISYNFDIHFQAVNEIQILFRKINKATKLITDPLKHLLVP